MMSSPHPISPNGPCRAISTMGCWFWSGRTPSIWETPPINTMARTPKVIRSPTLAK